MSEALGVLIVEDSEAERFFLRRTVERSRPGCFVVEFSYATEALAFLQREERPSLQRIFTDINMPLMDGFAFATAFAALAPDRRGSAEVWVVSHSIDPADREQAEAHPAISGFISKEYSAGDIDRVLPPQMTR